MISVVIPASGEREDVTRTVGDLLEHLAQPSEIIVVINCHGSAIAEQVEVLSQRHRQVRAVRFNSCIGKGEAILQGLRRCQGQVVGFVDADGPFPAELIVSQLILPVLAGEDCVVASKWRGKRYGEVQCYSRASKKLLSRGLNIATRLLFRLPMADTQGGAKFMWRAWLERVDTKLSSQGFEFDVELLWRLQREGASIREVYLPSQRTTRSTFRLREILRMTRSLLWIKVRGSASGRAESAIQAHRTH